MKKILLVLFLLPAFMKNGFGQMAVQAALDHYFSSFFQNSPAPGFSVVVVKEDKILYTKGFGTEKVDDVERMTPKTSSGVGSLTKSITAMAIMQLVEKGLVRLDDPVIKYLPDFRTANKQLSDKITVRMLLKNTSGLPAGVTQKWHSTAEPLDEFMRSMQSHYLSREPGRIYEYSNSAFSIAGLIISRVSGMSYADHLKKYIFEPLEMNRTTTDPKEFQHVQVLYGHHLGLHSGITARSSVEMIEMAPAGSLLRSSAEDLGHYLLALLNGGNYRNKQVLTPQSIHEMWSPQVSFPGLSYDRGGDGSSYHYGLGWMISEVDGRTIIHHGGSTGTMSSMTLIAPDHKLAASILFNIDYNFIDRYRFPSELRLINNLFHIIENEAITNYGTVRSTDPTLNNYQLDTELHDRYIGEYFFTSGDTWSLQGTSLKIKAGPDSLLYVQIWQGSEMIRYFSLDFINEANAVSRGIGGAEPVQFKLRPDGMVNGLFFSGAEFDKRPPEFFEEHQYLELSNGDVNFYFPNGWKIRQSGDEITANWEKVSGATAYIRLLPPGPLEFNAFIEDYLSSHQITREGLEIAEARGPILSRQKVYFTETQGTISQTLLLALETAGSNFLLVLSTPEGRLTPAIQDIIPVLLGTFSANQ